MGSTYSTISTSEAAHYQVLLIVLSSPFTEASWLVNKPHHYQTHYQVNGCHHWPNRAHILHPSSSSRQNPALPLMYKKRACTASVFTQPTNKYWTDQLKPFRSSDEHVGVGGQLRDEMQGFLNPSPPKDNQSYSQLNHPIPVLPSHLYRCHGCVILLGSEAFKDA